MPNSRIQLLLTELKAGGTASRRAKYPKHSELLEYASYEVPNLNNREARVQSSSLLNLPLPINGPNGARDAGDRGGPAARAAARAAARGNAL